jgi:hypothetical protein
MGGAGTHKVAARDGGVRNGEPDNLLRVDNEDGTDLGANGLDKMREGSGGVNTMQGKPFRSLLVAS